MKTNENVYIEVTLLEHEWPTFGKTRIAVETRARRASTVSTLFRVLQNFHLLVFLQRMGTRKKMFSISFIENNP